MNFNTLILLLLTSLLFSCADYKTGYADGYANKQQKTILVFGKDNYLKGFNAGQAEKFQQDWLAENPIDETAIQCRDIIVNVDPGVFFSSDYKPVMSEIYTR